jgi:hypothetical protein
MPAKFDFVSPGVQLREIDQSQLPPAQEADGIILIGRARTGPAMKPVKIKNLSDFIDVFGRPIDGVRQSDPWRQGNTAAPNYAAYAAQAYLAAGVGPVKYIRLLGLGKDNTNLAGWKMGTTYSAGSISGTKAAFGLFLAASGGNEDTSTSANTPFQANASLAAIFYTNGAQIALSGTVPSGSNQPAKLKHANGLTSTAVMTNANDYGLTLVVNGGSSSVEYANVNFNESSANYIRNVLNTDPTKIKNDKNYNKTVSTNKKYFLGETFDVDLKSKVTNSETGKVYAWILGLDGSDNIAADDFEQDLVEAKSGWFIGPKLGVNTEQKKLFRLIALNSGEEFQKDFYCVIKDIKTGSGLNPNASFTLEIVRRAVTIDRDYVVESYTGVNLNPNSSNFISKRIGDFSETWNQTLGKFTQSGQYPNISGYVRVEVSSDANKLDTPFGWAGQKKDADSIPTVKGGMADVASAVTEFDWIDGGNSLMKGNQEGVFLDGIPAGYTASFDWPVFGLTTTGTNVGSDYGATAMYGLRHALANRRHHDGSFADIARKRKNFTMHLEESDALSSSAQVFSLDDIKSSSVGATTYFFESGSFDSGDSINYHLGASGALDLGIKQFAAPFFGGADGVDIRYANPFSDTRITDGTTDGYAYNTIDQALEMVRYKENITCELMSMPGIINGSLGDKMIGIAQDRGDCLAVMDVDGIARDTWETESSAQVASISTLKGTLLTRQIDSSYAATYFPNVRMRDTLNDGNTILEAPPSVAAIGAIAKSDNLSQPWFAPAGFNRGGLARLGGTSGPAVIGTSLHLTKADRDTLYELSVNPIAKFPSTGDTVIFGQKTLQQDASALDRINVRRLMIYLKRQIGIIADTILFDQNVQVTWNRFKAQANQVLASVQADLGITEYKLVLDETTTTPDLIDRNILYAKIFVKPARSIEFIAIDFIITRSGVEF